MEILSVLLTLGGAAIGAAVTAAGFIAWVQRRDLRMRRVEKQVVFALSRTGNIMKRLGMEERYTDDLLRIMLAVEDTPQSTEAITHG